MKGISFNDVMARAWHEGRKPVTRRLMKPQPDSDHPWKRIPSYRLEHMMMETSGGLFCKFWHQIDENPESDSPLWVRPHYLPGESVYIKETWGESFTHIGGHLFGYKADKQARTCRLNGPIRWMPLDDNKPISDWKWKSPAIMPEWASRSHAKIISVMPERVQEITDEEISEEGLDVNFHAGDIATASVHLPGKVRHSTARECFRSLWESIYPGSWERNDWAWRIELEKIP